MELAKQLLIIFFCCLVSVYGNIFDYNHYCKIYPDEHFSTVNCHISYGQSWTKEQFRDWNQETKYILNINCSNNGTISLRRPYRLNGLVGLNVHNCYITDYFDYNFTADNQKVHSNIQNLTFSNCVLEFRESVYYTQIQNFTEEFLRQEKCQFPEELRTLKFSNVSFRYFRDKRYNSILRNEYYLRLLSSRCRYDNLIYMELSKDFGGDVNKYLINSLVEGGIFPALRELYLPGNKFDHVPDNLFTDSWYNVMPNLQKIDLSGNKLKHLYFLRKPYKRDLDVDLSRNSISEISNLDIDRLKKFTDPSSVNLRGNPIICCQGPLQDFINLVDNKPLTPYKYLKVMNCKDEEKMERNLSEFLSVESCLPTIGLPCILESRQRVNLNFFDKYKYIIFGFTLALLLCVCAGCLAAKYKTTIIRFFKAKTTRKCQCVNQGKSFDAFISYSSLDERWVYDVLCTKLKSKSPDINLCLHHKDFVPGACISENIINSVENSRFTLLILSRNFIESEWCHMEFQKAFHETLKHRRHLLVVLLEDVDLNKLDVDLRFFLQTYTYLKYSDALFWEKLSQTLGQSESVIKHPLPSRGNYQLLPPPDYKSCIENDTSQAENPV